eukprot:COSAG01_NODE_10285_length_2200_cov_17.519752_1_plen_100_part_00
MESSRRDGNDGCFTWGGALLQPELVGLWAKIGLGGHKPPIFTYTIAIQSYSMYNIWLLYVRVPEFLLRLNDFMFCGRLLAGTPGRAFFVRSSYTGPEAG